MIIAQITDTHVMAPGEIPFGAYEPARAVAPVVARLNALEPRPEIVLFTGDLTENGTREEYAHLRALLAPLDLPLAVIPGNHDRRADLVAAFAGSAARIGSGQFLNLAFELGPLTLIGLDTVVEGRSEGLICDTRLAWLEATLRATGDRPTLVFMHHPPFATGIRTMDRIGCEGGPALAELLAQHPQVQAVLCGHVHRPVARRFAHAAGIVCPSVAWALSLELDPARPSRVVYQPPGFQLHLWSDGGLVTHTDYLNASAPA